MLRAPTCSHRTVNPGTVHEYRRRERRFRNRMSRTHATGIAKTDSHEHRSRLTAALNHSCFPSYTPEEEHALSQMTCLRGGRRLYSGSGRQPLLLRNHRATSSGELAATGRSRMAGAGAFPSPIAHAARLESPTHEELMIDHESERQADQEMHATRNPPGRMRNRRHGPRPNDQAAPQSCYLRTFEN